MTAPYEPNISTGVVLTADPVPRILLVLLTTPAPGLHDTWQLPGGKVEPGEDPVTAAIREIREESGLDVEPTGRTWNRVHPKTRRRINYIHCLPATVSGPGPVRTRPGEISGVVWAPVARVDQYIPNGLYPPVREFVTAWAAGERP